MNIVERIRFLVGMGLTVHEIASDLGVRHGTVSDIMRLCSIPAAHRKKREFCPCGKPHHAKGLCNTCYAKRYRKTPQFDYVIEKRKGGV